MPEAWLTIDDTPSAGTDRLTDFLRERDVPALLYCRGDRLDENPAPAIRAIEKGFALGNHAYAHKRFGALTFDEGRAEIERAERLIDAAYQKANRPRPGKYFRFPHIDRGCGGWVVDYDRWPAHRETLMKLFADGLNIDLTPPSPEQVEKKHALQDYLRVQGFTVPFAGVTHPWYVETEMATAADALFTFSTSDWMITPRHAGKWPYKTLEDLKNKIDSDPWLAREDSAHIILAHDQDGLFEPVSALIIYLQKKGFMFNQIA